MAQPLLDDPSLAALALKAWSTQRVLKTGATPVTFSGADLQTLHDQAGSTDLTAVPTPLPPGPGDINGNRYLKLNGVDNRLTFSPDLVFPPGADFDIFMALGVPTDPTTASLGALIGHSVKSTSVRGVSGGRNLELRSDSGSDQPFDILYAPAVGFHVIRIKKRGDVWSIFLDREARGSRTKAGAVTLNQIGASISLAFSRMGFGECIIFGATLGDALAAKVETDMLNAWRSGVYVSQSGSDTSGLGWNPASPLQTISKVRTMLHRRGGRIWLKRGDIWRRDPLILNTSNQSGIRGDPIRIQAYGTGADPTLIGSQSVSGFTLVPGTADEYAASLPGVAGVAAVWKVQPAIQVAREGMPGRTFTTPDASVLRPGVLGSLLPGEYAVDLPAAQVHVNVGVGEDPNLYEFEVGHLGNGYPDPAGDVVRLASSNVEAHDLTVLYATGNAFRHEGGNDRLVRCKAYYAAFDGFGGAGLNLVQQDCIAFGSGKDRSPSGADGDGASVHGSSNIVRIGDTYIDNGKGGINDQDGVVSANIGCYLRGNNRNITVSEDPAGSGGAQTFVACVVVRTEIDHRYAVENAAQAEMVLYNPTIVNMGAALNTVAVRANSSNGTTLRNSICVGFASRLESPGAGLLTADHNLATNAVYGPGVSPGAGDLTADPVFYDPSCSDFRLQGGSPGIGAGAAIEAVRLDSLGGALRSPPDLGAMST